MKQTTRDRARINKTGSTRTNWTGNEYL